MKKISLNDLYKILTPLYHEGNLELEIKDLEYDSKSVSKDFCFFAIKGENFDGNLFIDEAINNGASSLVLSQDFYENRENIYKDIFIKIKKSNTPYIIVSDTIRAISIASAFFYDYPSKKLSLIGITGTNGKTSITYIIEKILNSLNHSTGIIGSTLYRYPQNTITNIEYTTPKSLYIERLLKEMLENDVKTVAIEASSHGIKMDRVRDLDFEVAIFTNLSRDHMDYHKTLEDYYETKKELFTDILIRSKKKKKFAIINIDDHYGKKIYDTIKHIPEFKTISYGFSTNCDYRITSYNVEDGKSYFTLENNNILNKYSIHLTGKHNIYNTVAAISAIIEAYSVKIQDIQTALNDDSFVIPGRLEKIQGYNIFIDYAHTDNALENVLKALRETFPSKRIITLFGAGGDRDKGKRPKMGSIVSEFTDYAIVTSDNPRTENPQTIIDSIIAGMKHQNYTSIIDREEAIKKSIEIFDTENDILLIAGKGHETYQIVGTTKTHFDDKELALKYLKTYKKNNLETRQ